MDVRQADNAGENSSRAAKKSRQEKVENLGEAKNKAPGGNAPI